MSVYNQLDHAEFTAVEWPPFGRVHPRDAAYGHIYFVGRDEHTGALVRSNVVNPHTLYDCYIKHDRMAPPANTTPAEVAAGLPNYMGWPSFRDHGWADTSWAAAFETWAELVNLPLIILAGLR